jgi:hypothetical protein
MRKSLIALALAGIVVGASLTWVRAAEPVKKADDMKCCAIDPKAAATLDRIKKLEGTWTTSPASPGAPAMSVVFKPTSGGSAVIETMFPGSDHEMINLFTADGDKVLLTHYCMLGQQPRMRQTASSDDKTMKFEFVDGGNIKSRDEGHMDAVALTIDGDKLTEDWTFYADGKAVEHKVFEYQKQAVK